MSVIRGPSRTARPSYSSMRGLDGSGSPVVLPKKSPAPHSSASMEPLAELSSQFPMGGMPSIDTHNTIVSPSYYPEARAALQAPMTKRKR